MVACTFTDQRVVIKHGEDDVSRQTEEDFVDQEEDQDMELQHGALTASSITPTVARVTS
jgi:hypothetical protein